MESRFNLEDFRITSDQILVHSYTNVHFNQETVSKVLGFDVHPGLFSRLEADILVWSEIFVS